MIVGASVCVAACGVGAGPWGRVAVLAALHGTCEWLVRRQTRVGAVAEAVAPEVSARWAAFFPVLLAAAALLRPGPAALVPVLGAVLAPAAPPRALRRLWNAAQLALATCAAAGVFRGLGGPGQLARHQFPAVLGPAVAAALAFCLVSGVLAAGIRITAERADPRTVWGGALLRSLVPCLGYGLIGLMMAVLWQGRYGVFSAVLVLLPLTVSSWVFAQFQQEEAAHQATVSALVQAVEIKDEYTRGHSERVSRASVLIARELRMAEERVASLRIAGVLHDIGKLGVPTRVLRKNGPLTDDEHEAVQLHPTFGHEMVRGIGFLGEAREGILHHHERMDGRGYPSGLAGDQIPEFARVIAVADAFDSMTSTRSYRRARPVDEAVTELERCSGTQFDPTMVGALIRAVRRHGWSPAQPRPGDEDAPDVPLGIREPSRAGLVG
ncbi:HD-GYP domain-containing protein [Streptacidiphilus melanogenes]|uniref:HD-GYP domain-containing protein n=1 Tax=Streptacidiphilus melanogenes TaxID=411235 RepID=UPI0007C719DA|nr:HD-GYP domain-containing protein [Streptacidiphilus melanogenes]